MAVVVVSVHVRVGDTPHWLKLCTFQTRSTWAVCARNTHTAQPSHVSHTCVGTVAREVWQGEGASKLHAPDAGIGNWRRYSPMQATAATRSLDSMATRCARAQPLEWPVR